MTRGLALMLALLLAGCQAADDRPTVYTAPPDILARTFAPHPPPSGATGVAAGTTASPVRGASPGPSVLPSSTGASTAGRSPVGLPAVSHPVRGQVVFGTSAGPDLCSVINPSAVLLGSQPFFFAAWLKEHMDGRQPVVLHITRNGTTLVDHNEPVGPASPSSNARRVGHHISGPRAAPAR